MTIYDWPEEFGVNMFEMRVAHNTRVFTSPFTGTAQVLDYTGERWQATIGMVPGNSVQRGAWLEAFFDRLRGPANRIRLWNLRRPQPLGSIRDGGGSAVWRTNSNAVATWQTSAPAAATWSYGGPALGAAMAAGSNLLPVARTPGTTIYAGDHLGAGGQLFRALDTYTVGSTGTVLVEVTPRARADIPISSPITCTKPTAVFMLKAEGVPISWRPGLFEGTSLELIEAP